MGGWGAAQGLLGAGQLGGCLLGGVAASGACWRLHQPAWGLLRAARLHFPAQPSPRTAPPPRCGTDRRPVVQSHRGGAGHRPRPPHRPDPPRARHAHHNRGWVAKGCGWLGVVGLAWAVRGYPVKEGVASLLPVPLPPSLPCWRPLLSAVHLRCVPPLPPACLPAWLALQIRLRTRSWSCSSANAPSSLRPSAAAAGAAPATWQK